MFGVKSIRECLSLSLWLLTFTGLSCGNYPLLDVDTNMRIVLLPHDMPVGGIIYRLRASDSDNNFPLSFEVLGAIGKGLLSLNFLGCVESESLCQADVVLRKTLDVGRTYEFQLQVKDTTGDYTKVHAAITATPATAHFNPLFGPRILHIMEDSKDGTIIEKFEVLKNEINSRFVHLEIREEKDRIGLKQRLVSNNRTEGTLFLKQPLDFETEPWFTFQLLAMNAWTNTSVDTRNILISDIIVAVHDVQDTPPVFTLLPPSIELNSSIKMGDLVARVEAIDGDKQNKRLIRYGFLSDSNPFIPFFDLDPMKGEIRLRRNITELLQMAKPNEPIKMTIIAEEIIPETGRFGRSIGSSLDRTMGNITFWFGRGNALGPPEFSSDRYVGELKENSLPGTLVEFSNNIVPSVWHPNPSEVISLSFTSPGGAITTFIGPVNRNNIERNNLLLLNTFQIIPSHGVGNFSFEIRVSDPSQLDYEMYHEIRLTLVGSTQSSTQTQEVDVKIYLRDENDNPPVFLQTEYHVDLPEGSPMGTKVIQLRAVDKDQGTSGKIMYTNLLGSDAFHLDQETGEITVDKPDLLDRETEPEIRLYIEAKDGGYTEFSNPSSIRNMATTTVVIRLLDRNDNGPVFQQRYYQAVLNPEMTSLKHPLQVKAFDEDEGANGQVKYTSLDSRFFVDPINGDVRLRTAFQKNPVESSGPFLGSFKIRAVDLGNPQKSSETTVQLFSEEMVTREIQFVFPSTPEKIKKNQTSIEKMLGALTGGIVGIQKITSLNGNSRSGLTEFSGFDATGSARSLDSFEATASPPLASNDKSLAGKSTKTANGSGDTGRHGKAEDLSVANDKSIVTATVQYPVSSTSTRVDLEAFQKAYGNGGIPNTGGNGNGGGGNGGSGKPSTDTEMIKLYEAENKALFWILITFLLLLLFLFLIFLCCIYCPCCWLYGHCYSKGAKSAQSDRERVVPVKRPMGRHRNNKTYPEPGTETEDSYDPQLDPESHRRPPRHARREAWSGDEHKSTSWRNHSRRYRDRPPTPHGKGRRPGPNYRNQQGDVSLEDWDFEPSHVQTDRADEIGPRWQHIQHTQQFPPQAQTIAVPVPMSMMPQVQGQPQQRRVGYVGYPHPGDDDFVRRGPPPEPQIQPSKTETYTPYNPTTTQSQLPRHYPAAAAPPESGRVQSVVQQRSTRFFKTDTGEVLQFADFEVDDEGKELLMKRYITEQSANDPQRPVHDVNDTPQRIIIEPEQDENATKPQPQVDRPRAAVVTKRPPKKSSSEEKETQEMVAPTPIVDLEAPKKSRSKLKDTRHHHNRTKEESRKEKSRNTRRRSQSLSDESEEVQKSTKSHSHAKSQSRSRSKSTSKSKDISRSRSRSFSPVERKSKSQSPRPPSAPPVESDKKSRTKSDLKSSKTLSKSRSKSKSTDREPEVEKTHHKTPRRVSKSKLKSKHKKSPEPADSTDLKGSNIVPVPVPIPVAPPAEQGSEDSENAQDLVGINIIPPSSAPMTDSSNVDVQGLGENDRVNSLPQTPEDNQSHEATSSEIITTTTVEKTITTTTMKQEEHIQQGVETSSVAVGDHTVDAVVVQEGGEEQDHFDEEDSGIGISTTGGAIRRNKMLEKKSVFTIAYDDVNMKSPLTIRPDTAPIDAEEENEGDKDIKI